MIGNDLVDLAAAAKESNWRRKGYLQKIFTETEQSYIINSPKPEIVVWILWSMKEAAYKIWNRESGMRSFNPKAFECQICQICENTATGKVYFGSAEYLSETIINTAFLHTTCRNHDYIKPLFTSIACHGSDIEMRNHIIRDKAGIPIAAKQPEAFISKSHHGMFCSYLSTFKLK
ncbi:phosphopantetheinyl transferase [Flavobacterium pallidum]|uniref:Phosphopantetheinyl transferase n=2 Tax=Flavobacterium pallidum TaxID=2172098 RepID=A0A2S1SLK7_9FLAO|nr:phosphopantetheinyl transferase [Flavobacterium pallidum]